MRKLPLNLPLLHQQTPHLKTTLTRIQIYIFSAGVSVLAPSPGPLFILYGSTNMTKLSTACIALFLMIFPLHASHDSQVRRQNLPRPADLIAPEDSPSIAFQSAQPPLQHPKPRRASSPLPLLQDEALFSQIRTESAPSISNSPRYSYFVLLGAGVSVIGAGTAGLIVWLLLR